MKKNEFRAADTRMPILITLNFIFTITYWICKPFIKKAQIFFELFDFFLYCKRTLKVRVFSSRKSLYQMILSEAKKNPGKSIFCEFGVAWGFTSHWFDSRLESAGGVAMNIMVSTPSKVCPMLGAILRQEVLTLQEARRMACQPMYIS